MKLQELLQHGENSLQSEDAKLEAWILFSEVFQMDRAQYFLNMQREAAESDIRKYSKMIYRRQKGEPVAYIIGNWEFMGLTFRVNPAVLIPRPDTETLVEAVIEWAKGRQAELAAPDILDLCTGSGCIAISLAYYLQKSRVEAADISPEAIAVAEANAKLNGVFVDFWQGDLWEALPAGRQYDVITSNPPYIDWEQLKELDTDVIDHEPRLALDGGEDGLIFYRRLAERTREFLKEGGRAFWEIGYDQGETAAAIARGHGLRLIEVRKDLAGHDRVVIVEKE
ncbi:MAG: peptide chain release factor N(5)-glutamine methyltransferase [Firmicutes bacterium]|nr:peptide chain release factor N(5)-glutamine methyltransferase [Bacillota bacterium]